MGRTRVRMTGKKQRTLDQIVQSIQRSDDVELVAKRDHCFGDVHVCFLVYEMYFFRTGSYASLSVLLVEQGEEQTADIVTSGGGEGLLNASYGAERSLARSCVRALEQIGFEIDPSASDEIPKSWLERLFP